MAIIISAVSLFFYANGGELAAVPGIILEGLVNVVIVEITSGPKTRLASISQINIHRGPLDFVGRTNPLVP